MPSKIIKLFTFFLVSLVFLFGLANFSLAQEERFVNIVNPVRGDDFWGLARQAPLDAVRGQWQVIKKNNLPATWLLRPDAFLNPEINSFFKELPGNQEIGIFLEVTPTWAREAKVSYHQEPLWHYANAVFLSAYTLEERKELIETAFAKFKEIFGFYPQSVGAWHLDVSSLAYMEKRYGLTSALICADQFLTDDYQIWGGWWGVPYYPSKDNTLIPAQSEKNKLNLVVFQWAARDPLNGYGGGIFESTFSVQANDYQQHGLGIDYFAQLVDFYLFPLKGEFGQITIGLENDLSWVKFGREYEKQIEALLRKNVQVVTLKDFSQWYQKKFPQLSPEHKIGGEDLLGQGKRAEWWLSTQGRLGLIEEEGQIKIRDWRVYNEKWAEPFLEVANRDHQLKLSLSAKIDSVRFPEQLQPLEGNPESLLNQKANLPFETPPWVFVLIALIFSGFLFFAFRLNKWLFLIILLGVISQSLTMIKSGLLYSYGMGFWGPNGHDGVWHLALINELTHHFESLRNFFSLPQNPIFAHFKLLNYHWLFDWLVALIHKITLIPVLNLYFQFLPLIFSGLLGMLVFILVKKLTKNNLSSLLAVFFVYFGGSFGWLVSWWRHQVLGGESMFWANQSISFLINPPFVLSLIFIFYGFYLFLNYLVKPSRLKLFWLSLIFGFIIGLKAYGGVIVLVGLALVSFWELIGKKRQGKKKNLAAVKVFCGSLLISLLVFLPTNWRSSSLFVFSPLWFPRTMLQFSDRLGWLRLDQARQAYLARGQWLKWLLAEGLALFIFLIGNLGTRIIGLGKIFSWFKNWRKVNSAQVFLSGCLFASGLLPLLFIQKGNPWNSIQFFYYFLVFFGLLAAWGLGEFLVKKKLGFKIVFISLLTLLTLPTTIGTLRHYLPYRAPARISFEELEALQFLSNQPPGIVLTYPYDEKLKERTEAPQPLFAYETTAYLPAFSGQTVFLADEMNLDIMQVDWRQRRGEVEEFFRTKDLSSAKEFLRTNQIRYLYLVADNSFLVNPQDLGANKIFENGLVKIYEFRDRIRTMN